MRIIYYCSYKLSPVGFQMGSIECSSLDGKMSLTYENVPKLVFKSFTARAVHAANGLMPSSNEYAVLRKNVNGEKDRLMFYINFCFLSGDEEEYLHARAFADRTAEDDSLFDKMAETVTADEGDESFALTIDGTALKKLLGEVEREKVREDAAVDSNKFIVLSQRFDDRREAREFSEELHNKMRLDDNLIVSAIDNAKNGEYLIAPKVEKKNLLKQGMERLKGAVDSLHNGHNIPYTGKHSAAIADKAADTESYGRNDYHWYYSNLS